MSTAMGLMRPDDRQLPPPPAPHEEQSWDYPRQPEADQHRALQQQSYPAPPPQHGEQTWDYQRPEADAQYRAQQQHADPPPAQHGEQTCDYPQQPQADAQSHAQQQQSYPPQSQYQRPRQASTSHSFSNKSHRSTGSDSKVTETHEEKEAQRLGTKADPNLAMSEAEPSAIANNDHVSQRMPLSALQHREATSGAVIAEPDRSNPTRSRWERPLDTIRSFEEAIDSKYHRSSVNRTSSSSASMANQRRFSNYAGAGYATPGGRSCMDPYSHGPPSASRRDSYYDGDGGNYRTSYNQRPQRYPRAASVGPVAYQNDYQQESYFPGYAGNHSGIQTPNESDPNSESSSMYYGDNYGYSGHADGMPPINESYQSAPMPAVAQTPRVPIRLGNAAPYDGGQQEFTPPKRESKRRSWFGRKFGKGE